MSEKAQERILIGLFTSGIIAALMVAHITF
ncbi:hypothetical protein JOD17_003134 [Geomicrobium sediminis]|uniref:Uncharacterized protein n=1 Tax=Geomicrobium sediminis TaxID=1347788 RepID=A0ABS2PFC2_9BACL|nr:hypothetical protein [Geomicrobium sediminis]